MKRETDLKCQIINDYVQILKQIKEDIQDLIFIDGKLYFDYKGVSE